MARPLIRSIPLLGSVADSEAMTDVQGSALQTAQGDVYGINRNNYPAESKAS